MSTQVMGGLVEREGTGTAAEVLAYVESSMRQSIRWWVIECPLLDVTTRERLRTAPYEDVLDVAIRLLRVARELQALGGAA